MLPRLDSIKQQRTKLRITQKKLASLVGVSTSMINQIESGRSQPSYETAKKIFDSLAKLEGESSSHKAGDFCTKEIVKMNPTNAIDEAVKKMENESISQIPIFDGTEPVGVITDEGILKKLANLSIMQWKKTKVRDAMDPTPPIIDFDTPANTLVPLIRFTKCILVSKKGKIVGIITASDTLKMME